MANSTMADVARHAGVDVSTVSRALNERTAGMLRAETVDRVLASAAELGYRPNVLARGLRTQRSHTVGMIIPDLTNPFFPPVVRGVEDALDAADYTLIVANTDNDPRRDARSLQTMIGRQVDGLILATSHLHGDGAADVGSLPVVLVNRRGRGTRAPSIVPDDRAGVSLVVQHLTELGHRRIAHVAGPPDTSTGLTRAEAFRDCAAALGAFDETLVEPAAVFAVGDGRAACERLLDRHDDVTAIVAANDLLAIGCLVELRQRGMRVPDDISLVGFNDMPLVDLIDPPLTTVRVPQYDMGVSAGRMLLELLQNDRNGDAGVEVVELPPELIVRSSTAHPSPDQDPRRER